MPIYEYQCQACGKRVEVLQKVSEPPLSECPACHQPALSKLVSAAAFHLKGSGWYVTDFRDQGKGKGKGDGATADQAGAGGKPDGAKPDTAKSDAGVAAAGKDTGSGAASSTPSKPAAKPGSGGTSGAAA